MNPGKPAMTPDRTWQPSRLPTCLSPSASATSGFESLSTITGLSDRRKVVGTIELFDDIRAVLPVLCAEPADQGRIPG